MGCGSSKEQATVEVRLRDGAKHEDRSFKRQDQATDKLVIRRTTSNGGRYEHINGVAACGLTTGPVVKHSAVSGHPAVEHPAVSGPAHSSISPSTDSDSDSEVASDWDRYSVHPETVHPAAAASPQSAGRVTPRDTVCSLSATGSVGSVMRLRQESLFGLGAAPSNEPVKDSKQLRLCKVSGVTFVSQYMVIKFLGRGSSGRVFLCMSLEDYRLYAVKIVKKDQAGQRSKASRSGQGKRSRHPAEDLRREIAVMRRALHPNVVALREVVDDDNSSKMLLVMDYLEGGAVMTREGLERGHRVPEEVARLYFRDMCKALDYLHCARRVVHGDLKPENALMGAAGRVALSDFGCSKVMKDADAEFERCNGTPAFLAPEMMRPHARYRGRPADVYALGGCLYSFVFGRIPFKADTVLELFETVQSMPLTFPEHPAVSPELKDLLLGMLEKDPDHRLPLAKVLHHPWLTAGSALPPLRSCQQVKLRAEREEEAAEQDRERLQQEQMLREALQGLVSGECEVQSFARGQTLMTRAHLLYILEGECEVHYKTAVPPPPTEHGHTAAASVAAAQPGAMHLQQQQTEDPEESILEQEARGRPTLAAAAKRRSAAGMFAADSYLGNSCASSVQPSAAATEEGGCYSASVSLVSGSTLAGSSVVQQQSQQQLKQQQQAGSTVYSRRNSSDVAEAAAAADDDLQRRPPGAAAGAAKQAHRTLQRLQSTASSQAPSLAQQLQQQAAATAALPHPVSSMLPPLPPLPPGPHPQLQAHLTSSPQRPQPLPLQQAKQLSIAIPGEPADGQHKPATPSQSPESASAAAAAAATAVGSGETTPASRSPDALPAVAAATPSPGPYGLKRHMGVDVEGAALQLASPGPPTERAAACSGRQPASEHGTGLQQGQGQAAGGQQQGVQGPADGQDSQQPEAATRARELLDGLCRGNRLYLVACRGPGDFLGEMEALSGSSSRRAATVVAASSSVQAAVIPYAAAKAYLAQHPLAKQQLAQLMWLRQSEDIVLEALARLAAVGDDVLQLLQRPE
ncbi:Calcium/calmodulin-dependent protein kinase kinase [Chlorella vulgaris]